MATIKWRPVVSEYAKVAYLQELIYQAKRKWNLNSAGSMGLFVVCVILIEIDLLGVVPDWPNPWIDALLFAPLVVVFTYSAHKEMKHYYEFS
jgi:hypothetical protein